MKKSRIITLVIGIYILIACAGAGTLYLKNQNTQSQAVRKEAETQNKETQEVALVQETQQVTRVQQTEAVTTVSATAIETLQNAESEQVAQPELSATEVSGESGQAVNDEEARRAAEEADAVMPDTEAPENATPSGLEIVTQPGKSYNGTITGACYVNVRSGPARGDRAVGYVARGTTGQLIKAGRYCSYVRFPQMEGYVYNLYLQVSER